MVAHVFNERTRPDVVIRYIFAGITSKVDACHNLNGTFAGQETPVDERLILINFVDNFDVVTEASKPVN
jgi:hypothetical protein